ncbi:hypothetical protein ACCT32_35655, partial [Rhizobium brockwellii]|uniref:hypothetical protein n=1 Tax=Rhizobium brockwellii TaxID=3019932 RepID=UPI003F9D11EF
MFLCSDYAPAPSSQSSKYCDYRIDKTERSREKFTEMEEPAMLIRLVRQHVAGFPFEDALPASR